MADYPRVHALLSELLHLVREDQELPTAILVNLHRVQLRAALRGLLAIGPDSTIVSTTKAINGINTNFERAYPRLSDGRIFERSRELEAVYALLPALNLPHLLPNEFKTVPVVEALFRQQDRGWYGYDPVLLLHALTWGTDIYSALVPQLEVELGLDPIVSEMLGQLTRVGHSLQVPILGYDGIDTFEGRASRGK